jgi:hypothetical protein
MEKVVYGASLTANTARYLLRLDDTPDYLFTLEQPELSTAKIANYWFERWAAARLVREDTAERLAAQTLVWPIRHGARVLLPEDETDQMSFKV